MTIRLIAAMLAVGAASLTVDVSASAGSKIKLEQGNDQTKYEYEDADCKYKYEHKFEEGEQKIQQSGDCGHLAGREVLGPYIIVPPGIEVIVLPTGN